MTAHPKARQHLLSLPRVKGQLTWKGNSCSIGWRLKVENSGRVTLSFDAVNVRAETAWMLTVLSEKQQFAEWGLVKGHTPDGQVSIESDHVAINVRNIKGPRVQLEGEASQLRLRYADDPPNTRGCRVIYFPVGMRGLSVQSADTTAGRLSVAGAKVEDFGALAGMVQIDAPVEARSLPDWLPLCDAVARQVLDIVSFADGRFITWSARELSVDERVVYREFFGAHPSGQPWDETFDWLNLQPVIDLALRAYTPALRAATGLEVAISWFVTHPSHTELQLLAACSALEHLVSVYLKQGQSEKPTLIPRPVFTIFHRRSRQFLADACGSQIDRLPMQKVRSRLGQINQASLEENLRAMLRAYGVPHSDIESAIGPAVLARNDVVHRGVYRQGDDDQHLYSHVAVLRELLKRTFLKLLRYEGVYHSLLHGPQRIHFPSLTPA
jgi:hypothetical protein